LAQGLVGTIAGIGAALSTTLTGLVAGSFGRTAGFLLVVAMASAAVAILDFRAGNEAIKAITQKP
jgi:sugar phosphate permease